jgi:hypothetical protein
MFLSPCEEVPRRDFRDGKEELITEVIIYDLTQAPFHRTLVPAIPKPPLTLRSSSSGGGTLGLTDSLFCFFTFVTAENLWGLVLC